MIVWAASPVIGRISIASTQTCPTGGGNFASVLPDAVLHDSGQGDAFLAPPAPHAAGVVQDDFVSGLLSQCSAPHSGGNGTDDDGLPDCEGVEPVRVTNQRSLGAGEAREEVSDFRDRKRDIFELHRNLL